MYQHSRFSTRALSVIAGGALLWLPLVEIGRAHV